MVPYSIVALIGGPGSSLSAITYGGSEVGQVDDVIFWKLERGMNP